MQRQLRYLGGPSPSIVDGRLAFQFGYTQDRTQRHTFAHRAAASDQRAPGVFIRPALISMDAVDANVTLRSFDGFGRGTCDLAPAVQAGTKPQVSALKGGTLARAHIGGV